jgi:hypothetical protein
MALLLDLYFKNAERARMEAQRAVLTNVRERAARAAETWLRMAQRLDRLKLSDGPNWPSNVSVERTALCGAFAVGHRWLCLT